MRRDEASSGHDFSTASGVVRLAKGLKVPLRLFFKL
jgi:hypothetical protein